MAETHAHPKVSCEGLGNPWWDEFGGLLGGLERRSRNSQGNLNLMILLPYLYCSLNSLEQSGVLPLLLPVVSQLLLAARSLPLCRIQLFPFHLPTLFLPDQLIPGEFQCLLVPQTRVNQVAPLGCDSYKQRANVNGFMLSPIFMVPSVQPSMATNSCAITKFICSRGNNNSNLSSI